MWPGYPGGDGLVEGREEKLGTLAFGRCISVKFPPGRVVGAGRVPVTGLEGRAVGSEGFIPPVGREKPGWATGREGCTEGREIGCEGREKLGCGAGRDTCGALIFGRDMPPPPAGRPPPCGLPPPRPPPPRAPPPNPAWVTSTHIQEQQTNPKMIVNPIRFIRHPPLPELEFRMLSRGEPSRVPGTVATPH